MGCGSCSTTKNGVPQGCGDKGHCTSGTCNKKNTYDWLANITAVDPSAFRYVEVSFKKGSRKDFFSLADHYDIVTGDMVVVESSAGYNIGRVSLSGELVRLQMKKKKVNTYDISLKVIRPANHRDLEKLDEARSKEKPSLVKARVISRTMGLDMKIGDVEYQADNKKATFYYTAEGRVDFRELVRSYAREFRVKIEMRQIGARQESARIGGIGSCGRELCCSTWLSDFKSVTTSAARYQNISINQTKLSGQCGRLKCCLNYELENYMEALSHFPKNADVLKSKNTKAFLIKTDIFKGIMYYNVKVELGRGPIIALDKEVVRDVLWMNKKGEFPESFDSLTQVEKEENKEEELEFADVTGEIELPRHQKKKSKNSRNNKKRNDNRRKKSNPKNSHKKRNPKHSKSKDQSNKSKNSGDKK